MAETNGISLGDRILVITLWIWAAISVFMAVRNFLRGNDEAWWDSITAVGLIVLVIIVMARFRKKRSS